MKPKKGKLKDWNMKLKEWTHTMKEWKIKSNLMIKNSIA